MAENNIFRQPDNGKINGNILSRIIDKFDNQQFITNEAYFQGSNVTILNKSFNGTPDNRVPLPFGRRTVLDIVGYAYKPGYVNYIFDTIEDNKEDQVDYIQEILDFNNENLISAEIFQDALIKGQGAELMFWEGNEEYPRFVQIPREQVIFVYDDSVIDKLLYSIRYYTSDVIDESGEVVKVKHADVYYPDIIQYYEQKEYQGEQSIDPQNKTQRNTTDQFRSYTLIAEEQHFFGEIPLYPYEINADRLGVFQCAIKIIDAMDDMTSDSILNALERFNDH